MVMTASICRVSAPRLPALLPGLPGRAVLPHPAPQNGRWSSGRGPRPLHACSCLHPPAPMAQSPHSHPLSRGPATHSQPPANHVSMSARHVVSRALNNCFIRVIVSFPAHAPQLHPPGPHLSHPQPKASCSLATVSPTWHKGENAVNMPYTSESVRKRQN